MHQVIKRWRALETGARRYLLHLAILTLSLSFVALYYNLAVLSLGYSRGFLGILQTVTQAVAALLSLPLWLGVQRLGLRTAIMVSVALYAAGILLFAAFPQAALLICSAALMGMASVLMQVTAAPLMMRLSDDATRDYLFSASAAVAIGLSGVGNLSAGFLADALGRALGVPADSSVTYRAVFAIAGVGVLASLPPLLLIREPGRTPAPSSLESAAAPTDEDALFNSAPPWLACARQWLRRLPAPLRALLRKPALVVKLLLPPFLISWGAALLIPYLNLYFRERFGLDNRALGALFAGFDVATGLASLTGPALAARLGKMRTVAVTRAIGVPLLLILGAASDLWLAIAAALARVVAFNMAAPLYDAYAMEQTEESARPFMIGLLGAAYSAGFLVAPLISTFVQERYGFGPLFAATALLYALSVVVTWWFFGKERR
ncbi:MAG: MFS transporter [Roseiflexaceae bacterium]|nr:MFS transporter [Roseiflexaceae bacterium]